MNKQNRTIHLYLLAGVATDPLFMDGFRQVLEDRLRRDGWSVHGELLYPYGDWSRSLLSQLREFRRDLWVRSRPHRSIGGQRTAAALRAGPPGGLPLLIGHSGGGIAAVHAARILGGEGTPPPRIVQIGSPKCPIPSWLRATALYAAAVNARGRPADPVTRLGHWGGWRRAAYGLPVWQPSLAAPAAIARLPIIGGHADYFRDSPSFVNRDGLSNLDIAIQAVYKWFQSTCEKEADDRYD